MSSLGLFYTPRCPKTPPFRTKTSHKFTETPPDFSETVEDTSQDFARI